MRTAVFGGSFNPVHNGHTALARAFIQRLSLDRVLVIPAYVSPFKQEGGAVLPEHRLAMCRLAFEGEKNIAVSDMEISRQTVSYTFETLQTLAAAYPDSRFFLITGADAFLTIQDWKNPQEIFRLATVCTVPRSGDHAEKLRRHAAFLRQSGAETEILDIDVMNVSSTEVRSRVKAGENIDGLVPEKVAAYIHENHLYGC